MSTEQENPREYPHVVIRVRPSIYARWKVVFLETGENRMADGKLTLEFPDAFQDGVLKPEALELAVAVLKGVTRQSGYRICLVLSPEKCIYVEPDGTTDETLEPPSGGLEFKG
jgi:hypothetical protein